MKREPLVTRATIVAIATALLGLLAAFGLKLSNDQQTAVIGFLSIAAPLVVALLTRHKVTPTEDPRP